MPPKQAKQTDDDLRRLQEEQKKLEEELKQKEEEKKYLEQTIPTGYIPPHSILINSLSLVFNDFFMEQAMIVEDSQTFARDYLKRILEREDIFNNFRSIDIQNLTDQVVYDFVFASIEIQMNQQSAQVLLNIIYQVYKNLNRKFRKEDEGQPIKSEESDWQLFRKLLVQHSNNDEGSIKYFTASQLVLIVEYVRKTYFAHWQLINLTQEIEQRPLEIILTMQIEKPTTDLHPLINALKYIPDNVGEDIQNEESLVFEEQLVPDIIETEPTDEDLLDPHLMALIRDRLNQAQDLMEQKIKSRHDEFQEKLVEMASQKKGKK